MIKCLSTALCFASALTVCAQQGGMVTAAAYAQAENTLIYTTQPLVDRGSVSPNWLSGDRFWYRTLTPQGSEFILVDAVKKTRSAAFDQQKLAAGLSAATGKQIQSSMLPFQTFIFLPDGKTISFQAYKVTWRCDLTAYTCTPDQSLTPPVKPGMDQSLMPPMKPGMAKAKRDDVLSPDGNRSAFIKENNLWICELKTNDSIQLTTDGIKDFGYATDNAGWKSGDGPILCWSPDSKKIATFKQDQRNVSDMYLVTTNVGKPTLQSWKYPLPGDKEIATISRVIIDVDNKKVIPLQIPPDPHRATLSDDISSSGSFDDIDWNDGDQLAFVSTSRDHKTEKFRIADPATGAVRQVFEETVATQYESGWGSINWKYLHKSNEIIWFSERDNWGHLYLYDALTGKLKNQITKGDWVVTRLLKVDEKKRLLYFIVDGRQPENPYYSQFYKIGFDGKGLTLLTPEEGNHVISLSPDGNYFIDSYSKPNIPPVMVLRDVNGKLVTNLEKADISRLTATGWKPPIPIVLKAHDGNTDLYGLLYTPTTLDPAKKYPVINYIYPGPQGGTIGSWSFISARGDNQALAELGFIVVTIEGTSNPLRSKSFHDRSYGNMSENTLPDQIAGIRQLAQQHAYIDTNRVGIWGHSGGGFATATAMFRYPDFYKVGISESGNHDNRNYEDDWGERYDGLLVPQKDGSSNYTVQANQLYAQNLKGKLLLAHGLMDNNVPPYNTMLVVEALEKANKSFDLIVFPNSPHSYGPYSLYMMRRRWDYFIKNLAGLEPPTDYILKAKPDMRTVLPN